MVILQTKNLVKKFDGVHAVDHVSLSFEQGKIISIVGPNGSGKTTLTNVLSGMMPIDGGSVVVQGVHLAKIHAYDVPDYGITRTFQEVRLFNQMTALDNLLVVLTERNPFIALFESKKKLHLEQAEAVLKRVGLWDKRHALAGNLSYGQRKLLEIGRALAMDAKIYLFDEPFAGLFPEMVKIIVGIMEQLREQGKTIILIEHNMDLIRKLSDYVMVMDSGQFLAEGKPNEVLGRKEVIEAYLGE